MIRFKHALAGLAAILAFSACTKTTFVDPPAKSTSEVLEYKIVNVPDDPIYGAVNEREKTIRVYIPYYYYLNQLQAEIKVPEGATISPNPADLIENLSEKMLKDSTIQYTVTGKDGSRCIYTLVIDTKQPNIRINELTTNAAIPTEINTSTNLNSFFGRSRIDLSGSGIIYRATPKIEPVVSFLNDEGVEVAQQAVLYAWYVDGDNTAFTITMPLSADLPAGLYRVKVSNYSRSVILKNKVKIVNP